MLIMTQAGHLPAAGQTHKTENSSEWCPRSHSWWGQMSGFLIGLPAPSCQLGGFSYYLRSGVGVSFLELLGRNSTRNGEETQPW